MGQSNQMHQLLAVVNDKKNQAKHIAGETIATFNKKSDHFDGLVKTYESFKEDGAKVPPEHKEIVTTVSDKVRYVMKTLVAGIDAQMSQEETNASGKARGKFTVGNKEFELSATSLLALEENLRRIAAMYRNIPTLDPAKAWVKDETTGEHVYKTKYPEIKYRTEKVNRPLTLAEATDKHKAQVQIITVDEQVGEYKTEYFSGKITPGEKSKLLSRIEDLIEKVKTARSEANQCEVVNTHIAEQLFDYINDGII